MIYNKQTKINTNKKAQTELLITNVFAVKRCNVIFLVDLYK